MKLQITGKLLALGLAAMAFAMTGCSGSQQEDEKLEVEGEEGAEAQAEGSAEATDNADGEATAEDGGDAEPTEPVAQDTPAEDPTPDTAASPSTSAGGYAATGGGTEAGRVVRYVNAAQAPLFGAANATAASVGQLLKGDRVMVVIEGSYARIADGMFIKVDHLSAKPVARERKDAVWKAPAH
jgi:hypothetical protein